MSIGRQHHSSHKRSGIKLVREREEILLFAVVEEDNNSCSGFLVALFTLSLSLSMKVNITIRPSHKTSTSITQDNRMSSPYDIEFTKRRRGLTVKGVCSRSNNPQWMVRNFMVLSFCQPIILWLLLIQQHAIGRTSSCCSSGSHHCQMIHGTAVTSMVLAFQPMTSLSNLQQHTGRRRYHVNEGRQSRCQQQKQSSPRRITSHAVLDTTQTSDTDSTLTATTIRRQHTRQVVPDKTYGDHIYSRVRQIGKLLTFQASNPKNSAYFFGNKNNLMEHYYQPVTPSRRIFQLVDDINSNNNNMIGITGTTNNNDNKIDRNMKPISMMTHTSNKSPSSTLDLLAENEKGQNVVFTSNGSTTSYEQPFGDERQVWEALASLEKDMSILDTMIGTKPQLSNLQLLLLGGAVLSTASSPFFSLAEFLPPTMAAFTAAIGIAAEYRGRVAVADSKEVASASLQCAAEAEGYLGLSYRYSF
jgi:hypothetical protein